MMKIRNPLSLKNKLKKNMNLWKKKILKKNLLILLPKHNRNLQLLALCLKRRPLRERLKPLSENNKHYIQKRSRKLKNQLQKR
jgi:hypothetical protein